jgi:tetratricopeptide (TPR) repeat protein
VGTIILRPVAKGSEHFVSLSTLSAPEEARKAFERAEKEASKEKPNLEKVGKELDKAVGVYPQFAAAWNRLGENRARLNDVTKAREAFEKAAESDAKFVPPLLSLALIDLRQNRMQEAAQWAGRALKILPELAEANYYNAIAQSSLGNVEAAEAAIKAVHASPDAARYPRTRFMLGNVYAQRGQIPQAAAEFKQFLAGESNTPAAEAVRKQLAEWEAAGLLR